MLKTETEANKTLTWGSLPYYFVSVHVGTDIHGHLGPYYLVSMCLKCMSVLTREVAAK